MPLHLLKLCVGADSIADLRGWVEARLGEMRARGEPPEQHHTTRMVPKRVAELLDGGSLYWVIRGAIAVRQPLVDVRPFTGEDGIARCRLVLDPDMVPVRGVPQRPFQGWRYLPHEAAPPDLAALGGEVADMPEAMRRDLRDLGLL